MIDLTTYIILSVVYLLTMHMALASSRGFHSFFGIGMFILGGAMGGALNSYISGFVFAMVMHFIFWSSGGD